MSDSSISINKFISSTGICSRREADRMLEAGRVQLNGQVARKGNRVEPGDRVTIDGKPLRHKPRQVYLLLNKPPGVTSTTDRKDKDNIIDFLGYPQRIFPVGRLDKASSGLIILTNDGDIVNKILRQENEHEKEYIVRVDRPVTREFVSRMSKGIRILGTVTKRCTVERTGKQTFRIILTQGLNRQIRRMCEALDYKVLALKRVRIMHLDLENLPAGHWRDMTREEIRLLMDKIDS